MSISTETSTSLTRMAMTVGAATAALMVVVSMLPFLQMFAWVVFAGGIYYGMNRFRKGNGNRITYSRALAAGVQTAFFASLILAFINYVIVSVISPSSLGAFLDTFEQLLQASSMPPEMIEQSMQQMREQISPGFLAFATVLSYNILGFILSLICGIFVRNSLTQRKPL